MELSTYTSEDLPLAVALECDDAMMKDLGGALSPEDMPAKHQRRLAGVARGDTWYFKIIPHPGSDPAGTIGIWQSSWQGTPIHEMGWMVLPAFQGRGLASKAACLLLDRARADGRFKSIHAFPGVSNGASNAICRKAGFTRLEACEVEYAGRTLQANHWKIDLAARAAPIHH